MSTITDTDFIQPISWSSIIAGAITTLAISLVLSLFGMSLGFSLLASSDNGINIFSAHLLWPAFSLIISLAAGGFVTGYLATRQALMHGLLVWALSLLLSIVLSVISVNSTLSLIDNALGSALYTSKESVVTSSTNSFKQDWSQIFASDEDVFNDIFPNAYLRSEEVNDPAVKDALKKSQIPELQANYLPYQLDLAKNSTSQAVKEIAINPPSSKQVIQNLISSFKQQMAQVNTAIDRDTIRQAIQKNSSLSPAQSQLATDHFIQERERVTDLLNNELKLAEINLNKAEQRYLELRKQANAAERKADAEAAKVALGTLIALLLGAIVSILMSLWATKKYAAKNRL